MDQKFEDQVNTHYKRLYYFALSLTKSEADAADYTQQTYLKLANNWKKIRDQTKIKSWLFSTLYRDFLDKQKRNKFKAEISFDVATAQLFDESNQHSSIDREVLLNALMSLEDTLRLPLTLYYLEDYSYREIAEILLIPIGTVMSRIHRAKSVLYELLTDTKPISKLAYS